MGTQVRMEKKEDLSRMIGRWKEKQEDTRRSAKELHEKTKSYFVRIIANAIRRDAEKHEEILQSVLDCLDCTVTITPDELGELSNLLSSHIEVEKKTEELAEVALKKHQHYITTYLMKYLIEDEKKNSVLMDRLNEFKGKLYPYG